MNTSPRVHILAIDVALQAQLIRAAAEHFGAFVTMTWVGNSAQIVGYLTDYPAAEVIIISGHGEERGLVLPELGEEFKHLYPYGNVIGPADFAEFLHLQGNIVINNSCLGGMPEMASVFLDHGAEIYIGAVDYPDTAASSKYAVDFLYSYLVENPKDAAKAHEAASSHADDRQQFKMYRRQDANAE